MLHRFLIALALFLLPAPALAQDMEGSWDFRIDGTTIFRFDIEEGQDGEWLGEWSRPAEFNTDGNNFANMAGGVKSTASMTGIEFLGLIELSFDDPRPGAIPDIFRFERKGPDSAEMTYVGTDLAPYQLVRAEEGDPIGDWDASHIYRRPLPGNAGDGDIRVRDVSPLHLLDLSGSDEVAGGDPEVQADEAAPEESEEAAGAAEEQSEEEAEESPSLIGDDFLEGL